MVTKNVYPNVVAEMARNGISITELADRMGVSRASISNKLNGKNKMYLSDVLAIQKVLSEKAGVLSLDYLFENAE